MPIYGALVPQGYMSIKTAPYRNKPSIIKSNDKNRKYFKSPFFSVATGCVGGYVKPIFYYKIDSTKQVTTPNQATTQYSKPQLSQ